MYGIILMELYYYTYNTIIGSLNITADDFYIRYISIGKYKNDNHILKETEIINNAFIQINEYLSGSRKNFSLNIKYEGTLFQQKVWQSLLNIPYGNTISYKELAEKVLSPKAYRAAGSACGQNPLPIIVPCHRVIHSNGNISGYALGAEIKRFLLNLEKNSLTGKF